MIVKSAKTAIEAFLSGEEFVIYNGDCKTLIRQLPDAIFDITVTSPPYFMGKRYDKSTKLSDFTKMHEFLAPEVFRITKDQGNVCWQTGYFIKGAEVFPLDYETFRIFSDNKFILRNRIIWTFGHGAHCRKRLSGRHETVMWYSKAADSHFDLDPIRVPQKYPGKRHYKGPKKGQFSGNPKGKNPSDVWLIPNVNATHVEKTEHPCQFPVTLVERLVNSLAPASGTVFDPFAGSGSAGIAAVLNGRRFLGAEMDRSYAKISEQRYRDFKSEILRYREDKPIRIPRTTEAVSQKPKHFEF